MSAARKPWKYVKKKSYFHISHNGDNGMMNTQKMHQK